VVKQKTWLMLSSRYAACLQVLHLKVEEAEVVLRCSSTTLQKISRGMGIPRWPAEKIQSVRNYMQTYEAAGRTEDVQYLQ
jgi:hypothetical protein